MEKKRYDAVVIGAGVTGSAIARELSRYQAEICVLEKGEDVCTGTSKANSAIVHGGFDAKTGSLKAKMNVLGNRMMTQVAEELDVPFRRNGAFVLCFDENDMPALKELYERGVTNGVENLKILTGDEAREMEPALSDTVVAALFCPSSGIVCPFELTLGFAENAEKNGVEFKFECGVQNIRRENDLYILETEQGEIETRAVINAAGVHADEIHDMLLPHAFTITPRRGEYCLCDKNAGNLVDKTIFQLPTKLGKGILVTPTVHGNLLLGPTAENIEDREDTATTQSGLAFVLEKAGMSVKTCQADRSSHRSPACAPARTEATSSWRKARRTSLKPRASNPRASQARLPSVFIWRKWRRKRLALRKKKASIPFVTASCTSIRSASKNAPRKSVKTRSTAVLSAAARRSPRARLWTPYAVRSARKRWTA